jgi:hypothetical protein
MFLRKWFTGVIRMMGKNCSMLGLFMEIFMFIFYRLMEEVWETGITAWNKNGLKKILSSILQNDYRYRSKWNRINKRR